MNKNEKVFYLPLSKALDQVKIVGMRFYARLKINKQTCTVHIFVRSGGHVLGCIMQYDDGRLMFADSMLQLIQDHREWKVEVAPQIEQLYQQYVRQFQLSTSTNTPKGVSMPLSIIPPPTMILLPRRQLETQDLYTLAERDILILRTIHGLINGQRTVDEIRMLVPQLSKPTIDQVLAFLITRGIIE